MNGQTGLWCRQGTSKYIGGKKHDWPDPKAADDEKKLLIQKLKRISFLLNLLKFLFFTFLFTLLRVWETKGICLLLSFFWYFFFLF